MLLRPSHSILNGTPRGTAAIQGPERQWETIRATYTTSNPEAFDPATEKHVYSHKVGIDYRVYPFGTVGQYFFDRNAQEVRDKLFKSELMKERVIKRLFDA